MNSLTPPRNLLDLGSPRGTLVVSSDVHLHPRTNILRKINRRCPVKTLDKCSKYRWHEILNYTSSKKDLKNELRRQKTGSVGKRSNVPTTRPTNLSCRSSSHDKGLGRRKRGDSSQIEISERPQVVRTENTP